VLLITSRETQPWVLPKGWAEKGLTGAEFACKEAFEEAGIIGRTRETAVGSYDYRKRLADGSHRRCKVSVFPMTVDQELDDWPERGEWRRQWFTPDEAAALVAERELAELLRRPVR
jgi:8-oxo-dGTP pyrophosphatase MutT (NUDIX family)